MYSPSSYGPLLIQFRVLANYSGVEAWTEKEEAHVTRKIDWRLMPILCITYGLQYYDKAMLSQAVRILRSRGLLTLLTDPRPGAFWITRRSETPYWQSLLHERRHLLLRVHRRIVPGDVLSPALAH
jgi:hypothetical protein